MKKPGKNKKYDQKLKNEESGKIKRIPGANAVRDSKRANEATKINPPDTAADEIFSRGSIHLAISEI